VAAPPATRRDPRRAEQAEVACIDEWQNHDGSRAFGGTCLNAGCIPSKALLESSELCTARSTSSRPRHRGDRIGVDRRDAAMQKRKAGIVKGMTGGIAAAASRPRASSALQGHGRLLGGRQDCGRVHGARRREADAVARHVVLASGSQPMELKAVPFDGKRIVDSWGALEFDAVPKRLGVIGAGVIGLELGSVWRRLGAEVVVLEAAEQFLAMADASWSPKEALKQLQEAGPRHPPWAPRSGGAKVDNGEVSVATRMPAGRAVGDRRQAGGRRRPRPFTQGLLGRGHGRRAGRARLHQGGRRLPHRCAQCLGRRRLRARADARAQGQGRGRHGRRTSSPACYGR
jgi:dihydrolipoamide dehydrogenase